MRNNIKNYEAGEELAQDKNKEDLTDITEAEILNCPAPEGSYKAWLTSLNETFNVTKLTILKVKYCTTPASLSGSSFSGLQNLKSLDLSGSLTTLDSGLLSGLSQLQTFRYIKQRLSCNFTTISKSAFQSNRKLTEIVIRHSDIRSIEIETFKGLFNLQVLDLRFNRIVSLTKENFSDVTKLKVIDIKNNTLSQVNGTFDQITNLEELYIDNNPIADLPHNLLSNKPNLTDFSGSGLKVDSIPENLFENNAKLVNLILQRNNLKTLPSKLFRGLKDLKYLDLENNSLTNSALGANGSLLADLTSLKELDLRDNQFTSPITPHLQHVQTTLRKVNLNNNKITSFEEEWSINFPSLEKINMERNQLKGSLNQNLLNFSQDVELDLHSVSITRLILNQQPDQCRSTVTLDLRGNRLVQDCFAFEVWKILNDDKTYCLKIEGLLNENNISTDGPEKFTCDVSCQKLMPEEYYKDCVCTYMPHNRSATVNCLSKGLAATDKISDQFLSDLDLDERVEKITVLLNGKGLTSFEKMFVNDTTKEKVTKVYASNNKIAEIVQSDLPNYLTTLHLANNHIEKLSIESLNYLDTFKKCEPGSDTGCLALGGNPLLCNCEAKLLHERLTGGLMAKIEDAQQIEFQCSPPSPLGKTLTSTLCPTMHAEISAASIIFVLLLLVLVILVVSKREHLKLWIYRQPCVTRRYPEDWSLLYDVFISYVHNDQEYAEDKLHPKMEAELGENSCCIHVRDFEVGEAIPDQIMANIQSSRRTVIVLSPEYIAAKWTMLEFKAAHDRARVSPRQRLILVLPPAGRLLDSTEVPEELRPYLPTILRADDPKFWVKLRLLLPQQGRQKTEELELDRQVA